MRRIWLVCYDVREPGRLRRVYKLMRGYGDRVQYSVFRCVLGARERVELQARLERTIALDADHVLFVDLGLAEGRGEQAMRSIGKPLPEIEALAFIF